ncbi:MAG: hypothetical protein AB1505_35655 [Candidatus Latescibacterota bacterium]
MPTTDAPPQGSLPLPFVWTRDQMILYTRQYEGERFPDGRPRVPDAVLVADLMDKQIGGGFIGDNLTNTIYQKTGTGCCHGRPAAGCQPRD